MKRRFWVFVGGLCLGTAFFFLFFHPSFATRDIVFEGNQFIDDGRMVDFFEPFVGRNRYQLLFFPSLRRTLAAEFPSVESFSISLIDDVVHVQIQEKQAWIAFVSSGQYYVVSEDGTVLNWMSEASMPADGDPLLIVHGLDISAFSEPRVNSALIGGLSLVVALVDEYFSGLPIDIIFRHSDTDFNEGLVLQGELELVLDERLTIYLGGVNDMDLKFSLLKSFLQSEYYHSSYRTLDLRIPERLYASKK